MNTSNKILGDSERKQTLALRDAPAPLAQFFLRPRLMLSDDCNREAFVQETLSVSHALSPSHCREFLNIKKQERLTPTMDESFVVFCSVPVDVRLALFAAWPRFSAAEPPC